MDNDILEIQCHMSVSQVIWCECCHIMTYMGEQMGCSIAIVQNRLATRLCFWYVYLLLLYNTTNKQYNITGLAIISH